MESNGYARGYFLGVFLRFVWLFIITFAFQTMMIYIFGFNGFTYVALSIIFSFLINTSLPIRQDYPFFRHILIFGCLIVAVLNWSVPILQRIGSFYTPSSLWSTLILISFFFGVISAFGRIGNGLHSKNIEMVGNLILLLFIILSFFLFWWEGAIVYILFRAPLIFLETSIANAIMYFMWRHNESTIES